MFNDYPTGVAAAKRRTQKIQSTKDKGTYAYEKLIDTLCHAVAGKPNEAFIFGGDWKIDTGVFLKRCELTTKRCAAQFRANGGRE